MSDNIAAQIFEPYFTTKSKTSSLGIGLYMSKIILEKHFNAELYLDLHDEQGRTAFTIKLPNTI